MKKFSLLLAISALLATTSVFSQTTKDKWLIGVGAHAVDYTSVRGVFDGFFDYDDYSIVPPLSKLTVARSLNNSFAVDFAASFGEVDNKRIHIGDEFYALVGLGLRYKLTNNYLLKEDSWFDPYLRVGGNYHRYDYTSFTTPHLDSNNDLLVQPVTPQENNFVFNGGAGINFWFSKNFGINVESNYNWVPAFEQDYFNHFQHSVSAIFRFGNTDNDGDGIANKDDKCPDVYGPIENNGCPYEDTDGDGIFDNVDNCVDVPGPADNQGCPYEDTDGDGILDKDDSCPKVAGISKFNGCPDTDGDGLQDSKDDCPTVAGPVSNKGCPKTTPTDTEVIEAATVALDNLLFDTNSAVIRADQQFKIDNAAKIISEGEGNYFIDGYTDTRGSAVYNKNLSEKRAKAVVAALEAKGVPAGKLTARGLGENAKYDESTPEGLAKNRRVILSLKN